MKLKIISTISIVLIIIAIYFAFFKNSNSVFNKYDFALKDTSEIDLIIIENSSNKIILKKNNNEWKLNKNYYANKKAVKNFLRVYSNLDFVGKVDNDFKDSILIALNKGGIKVTIRNNDDIISELIIGDLNKYKTGTYVIKKNSEALIINSTGITNDISKVISINSLFWRNKTIFNYNINEINKVDFINFKDKNKSFSIEKTKNTFILNNFENKKIKSNIKKIKRYLSYFRNINFTKLEKKYSEVQKKTILNENLAYNIIITDIQNNKYKLRLYLKPDLQKEEYQYDLNYIYGMFNKDTNLLIISYYTIDPILKEISYFVDNQ